MANVLCINIDNRLVQMSIIYTEHAKERMKYRRISKPEVEETVF